MVKPPIAATIISIAMCNIIHSPLYFHYFLLSFLSIIEDENVAKRRGHEDLLLRMIHANMPIDNPIIQHRSRIYGLLTNIFITSIKGYDFFTKI
nr:MAG TPA: hypothetical protein [Caudoviricetes sp.]